MLRHVALVVSYKATQFNITGDGILRRHRRETPKSYLLVTFLFNCNKVLGCPGFQ
jgi:hypothetical protein